MKNSIISTGWQYSTARMLIDYTEKLYLPLCNLYNKYYSDLENVIRLNEWVDDIKNRWDGIRIKQLDNLNNITIDAGNNIEVRCIVDLQNINPNNVSIQVYSGKVLDTGILEDIKITEMEKVSKDSNEYKAKIALMAGGNYGYTFRVMPKHEMILDVQNLNLVRWITKEMQEEPVKNETPAEGEETKQETENPQAEEQKNENVNETVNPEIESNETQVEEKQVENIEESVPQEPISEEEKKEEIPEEEKNQV